MSNSDDVMDLGYFGDSEAGEGNLCVFVRSDELRWYWWHSFGPPAVDARPVDVAVSIVRAGIEANARPVQACFELSMNVVAPHCAFLDHVHFQAPFGIRRNPYLGSNVELTGFELRLDQGVLGMESLHVSHADGFYWCKVTLSSPLQETDLFRPSFAAEVDRHIRQVVFGERS